MSFLAGPRRWTNLVCFRLPDSRRTMIAYIWNRGTLAAFSSAFRRGFEFTSSNSSGATLRPRFALRNIRWHLTFVCHLTRIPDSLCLFFKSFLASSTLDGRNEKPLNAARGNGGRREGGSILSWYIYGMWHGEDARGPGTCRVRSPHAWLPITRAVAEFGFGMRLNYM